MRSKFLFLSVTGFLGFALLFSPKVLAEDSSSSSGNSTSTPKATETSKPSPTPKPTASFFRFSEKSETPEASETPRVKGIDKLEGLRLEFCKKHEDEVEKRLTSLGNLVVNMLGKFDAIATRVEQFYVNKVLPSGKTVPNYNALVSNIAATKAAVDTALKNAQDDVKNFTCTSDNPKGEIRQYRVDMQAVKKALHDYRTSIKNLIVAVRSVMGETEKESPKPSETPEPTATPTATP